MRRVASAVLLASMLAAAAACGTILAITPDNGESTAGDAAADTANGEGGSQSDGGGVDAEAPWAACTPMVGGGSDEAQLCAPRYFAGAMTSGGDAAAPFLAGAYAFDTNNDGFEDSCPCSQKASFFISWDASFLHVFGRMIDPNAVLGHNGFNPGIEAMLCAGDPYTDYDEAHCVDFIVEFDGALKGAPRFDPGPAGITGSATGTITDFTITAKVPAKDFGGLVSGQHMIVNVNAISFAADTPMSRRTSISAWSIPNRKCNHDAGLSTSPFTCGANDQSYEPERWAPMILE